MNAKAPGVTPVRVFGRGWARALPIKKQEGEAGAAAVAPQPPEGLAEQVTLRKGGGVFCFSHSRFQIVILYPTIRK